jgi:hypothetical protein
MSPGHPVPAQLRRRRAASRRLPVLEDGRSDPIDPPRPRRYVTVRAIGSKSIEFDGPGVVAAIGTIGCKSMRSRHGGGWLVPEAAGEDVMALLEYRGFALQVTL